MIPWTLWDARYVAEIMLFLACDDARAFELNLKQQCEEGGECAQQIMIVGGRLSNTRDPKERLLPYSGIVPIVESFTVLKILLIHLIVAGDNRLSQRYVRARECPGQSPFTLERAGTDGRHQLAAYVAISSHQ
jgi:hypothetical protein